MNVSANIDSQPTIEEYSKAVEGKSGLESGDADTLAKYLRYSSYSEEIEKSLRRNDGSVDEWTFKALSDEEAMEDFTEHIENKKKIRKMGRRIRELEEENEDLKSSAQTGDTHIYNSPEANVGETEVNVSSDSTAAATAEASAGLQQEIDGFIDLGLV